MKKVRKLAGLLLALVMVMGLSVTALADDTGSITIKGVESDAHIFSAYQIFSGSLSGEGTTASPYVLSSVEWGTGVNTTKEVDTLTLLDAIIAISVDSNTPFSNCTDAASVANVLTECQNDSAVVTAFSKVVAKYLDTANSSSTSSGSEQSDGTYTYTISGLNYGYYLVTDSSTTSSEAVSTYLLQVVGSAKVNTKAVTPTLEKTVSDDETTYDTYTNGSIGDSVSFKLTSIVPDVRGYVTYFFVINDTMSKGLTFNDDVAVTVGSTALVKDTTNDNSCGAGYFYVTDFTDSDGVTTIKIVIESAVELFSDTTVCSVGDTITVTYSATINQDCDYTSNGNTNSATLTYSNDPTDDADGDPDNPDEPGDDDPTGVTPVTVTTTYVTGIQITKVDAQDNTKTLTGAKFQISGNALNVVYVNSEIFEEDNTNGTYWRLTDGTYTTIDPSSLTDTSKYEDTTTKYTKVTVVTKDTDNSDFVAEGYVDDDGILTFKGLGEGTYEITELVAPSGYNLLKDKIYVTIAMNTKGVWKVTYKIGSNGSEETLSSNSDSLYAFNVTNSTGSSLPTTGGMGTTAFYIIGSLLVFGAVVVLITRRRMRAE